jgi:hypothetical protein
VTKEEYILRSLSKIRHKKWELFVITRIIHKLDDPDIEFVCQQYINIKGDSHHLADLCFPSLKLYYEIDEAQHDEEDHKEKDKKRTEKILKVSKEYENKLKQRETLEATDWIVKRIRVYDKSKPDSNRDINEVIKEIDQFVDFIKDRKKKFEKKLNKKIVWDFEKKYDPQRYIENGSISVGENVVFRYVKDCLKLFGYTSDVSPQTGWWKKGTIHLNQAVWLPKLYENKNWDNKLSEDGLTIYEKSKQEHLKITDFKKGPPLDRIVFAHYKNIFGQTVYKFYGIFRTDMKMSKNLEHVHRRISTKINLKDYI